MVRCPKEVRVEIVVGFRSCVGFPSGRGRVGARATSTSDTPNFRVLHRIFWWGSRVLSDGFGFMTD